MIYESATLHSAGDCSVYCVHPDHDYDGEPIDLGLFLEDGALLAF